MSKNKKAYRDYTKPVVEEPVLAVQEETEAVIEPAVVVEVPELPNVPFALMGNVTGCGKLNVRKRPAIDAAIACVLDCFAEVTVYEAESTDEFYKICTASGVEGYCMKQFIKIQQ